VDDRPVYGQSSIVRITGENMDKNEIAKSIESGKTVLGIELGSTRIKAVLIGEDHAPDRLR
jgi:activator of 2-hydroxyglutaryl-CoA dehydratase